MKAILLRRLDALHSAYKTSHGCPSGPPLLQFFLSLCVHHIVPIFSLNDLALLLVFEEELLFVVTWMVWRSSDGLLWSVVMVFVDIAVTCMYLCPLLRSWLVHQSSAVPTLCSCWCAALSS